MGGRGEGAGRGEGKGGGGGGGGGCRNPSLDENHQLSRLDKKISVERLLSSPIVLALVKNITGGLSWHCEKNQNIKTDFPFPKRKVLCIERISGTGCTT